MAVIEAKLDCLPLPVLLTERLRLRPVVREDREILFALAGEEVIARWTEAIPHPLALDHVDGWITEALAEHKSGEAVNYALTRLADGALIGMITLSLPTQTDPAELGFWLGRAYWQQGFMHEALTAVIAYGFQTFALTELTARTIADNEASLKTQDTLGFRRIGRVPHDAPRCQDAILTRLSRLEWQEQRAMLPIKLVVAAILLNSERQILLAQRPPGRSFAGLWEFPGGKLMPNELPAFALARELREELGIEIDRGECAPFSFADHSYPRFHLLMPIYLCRNWRGTPIPREGQTLAWVGVNQLDEYEMPPADIPLAAQAKAWLTQA